MYTYKINKYNAFKKFKCEVGNNNQFLITAIIGINKVNEGDKNNASNPAPWSPCNVDVAKIRSTHFVKKAGLAWTIDCLDELLKDFFHTFFSTKNTFYKLDDNTVVCRETTTILPSEQKEENFLKYEQVNRSVYQKFTVISDFIAAKETDLLDWRQNIDFRVGKKESTPYFPKLELVVALIDLAIQWRNNLVHSGVSNPLAMNTSRILKKNSSLLNSNQYGTLEINRMLDNFKKTDGIMDFKELTVLIRNIIDFGFILNAYWIHEVDTDVLLYRELTELLPPDTKNDYYVKLYSLSPERRKGSIIMTLGQRGIFLKRIEDKEISKEEECINHYLRELLSCI